MDSLAKLTLLLFLCVLTVSSVEAKVKVCDLQLIVQDRESKSAVETVIANLVSPANKTVISAEKQNGSLFFKGVKEDIYILSAGADDYKTSLKLIKFVCNEKQTNFNNIYLLKGKPGEQIQIIDKDFVITQNLNLASNIFALNLPKPVYPQTAQPKPSGTVVVEVFVNEKGNVYQAKTVIGDPIFWKTSEEAAKRARFIPAVIDGKPAGFVSKINYIFVGQ